MTPPAGKGILGMKTQVNGNTEGIREAMLARLESLYGYETEEGLFLPRDLMKTLAECRAP